MFKDLTEYVDPELLGLVWFGSGIIFPDPDSALFALPVFISFLIWPVSLGTRYRIWIRIRNDLKRRIRNKSSRVHNTTVGTSRAFSKKLQGMFLFFLIIYCIFSLQLTGVFGKRRKNTRQQKLTLLKFVMEINCKINLNVFFVSEHELPFRGWVFTNWIVQGREEQYLYK